MFKPAMKLGAVVVFCTTVLACGDDASDGAGAGGGGAGGGSGGVSGMMAGVGGATGGAGGGGMTGGAGGGGMTGGTGGMTGGAGGMTGGAGGMTGGAGGMTGGMGGTPPTGDPTWPAIYSEIIKAKGCSAGGMCHGGPGGGLDMSTMEGAYDALINIDAMGVNPAQGNCFGTGIKRVVPMQPDMSLLYQKIAHTQTCGAPMPPGVMLEAAQIEQVRMWIMAGAAEM